VLKDRTVIAAQMSKVRDVSTAHPLRGRLVRIVILNAVGQSTEFSGVRVANASQQLQSMHGSFGPSWNRPRYSSTQILPKCFCDS